MTGGATAVGTTAAAGISASEVAAAAAALGAIGTGVNAYSQNQNLRNQDKQAAASIAAQGNLNKQASQQVTNLTKNVAASDPAAAQKQQMAAYLSAIQQAAPVQSTANVGTPGASNRFVQASANSKNDVSNYARSTASALASTAAPQLQRINEGNQIANTASNLGLLQDQSNAQSGILKTQLAGDQANPWLTSLSQVLQGAGQGGSIYAGGMSGTKKPSSTNPYLSG